MSANQSMNQQKEKGVRATPAVGYATHSSRSHDAVIRVSDAAGNVIEKHEHKGEFKEW